MNSNASIETFGTSDQSGALRSAIYGGAIFVLPATVASHTLAALVRERLRELFPECDDPRQAQFNIENGDYFGRIGTLRKELTESSRYVALQREILTEIGFAPDEHLADALRLRALWHGGHEIAAAAKAYAAHRDTWFANPQAQVNWWMPVYDVRAEQTFAIYEDYFRRPIANDSAEFDYEWFRAEAGWQNHSKRGAKVTYPEPKEPIRSKQTKSFDLAAGALLLFSASHLHQTIPHSSGETRFSIDFRTVHKADYANGRGAPNVDNESRGSALVDYRSLI